MALIDTYRNNVSRKRTELSKLSNDRAKESEKKAKTKNCVCNEFFETHIVTIDNTIQKL